ncbi:MAG: response regulator [Campylobacterales bacterium]|nr:response regulator [Campylobacterales bacterium]
MDFSKIFSFLNEMVPNTIAGIDTFYIAAGVAVMILAAWTVAKMSKKSPRRELVDIITSEPEIERENSAIAAGEMDNGFMSSESSAAAQEFETSVGPFVLVKEEETRTEPAANASCMSRKKRESMRNGKKISKADFSDFSGQRLLIAEDNLINQKVLNSILNESGIDVVMADDGQVVLDVLEKDSVFDIILMDAHMPRVDGFEATRKIRENPAYDHIAVVALSGDTASDDIRHMREAGMEEILEKPLKMDMLYDVMSMYYNEPEKEAAGSGPEIEDLEIALDVSELASLDYDLGLEICGGDEEMYRGLLREFFVSYRDSAKNLRDALVQKDYIEVQSILIDLKGTASNLGAKQFIYVVDHFIDALSKKNTSAYSELFKEYQSNLLILLKSIQNSFKV